MGKVVKRPPPWTVMPGVAVNVLPVAVVSVRLSCGFGGGGKNTSFHTPPPRACPWGPCAVAVLPLMVVPDTSSSPLPWSMPAPRTVADPVWVVAVSRLPLTRLLLSVVSVVWIPPASACAVPVAAVALTSFPVMEVFEIVALPWKSIPSPPEVGFAVPVAAGVGAAVGGAGGGRGPRGGLSVIGDAAGEGVCIGDSAAGGGPVMADRRVADGRGSVDEDAAAMRVAADGVTRELDGVAADGAGGDRELAERGDAAAFGAAPVRRRRHRAVAPDDGVG